MHTGNAARDIANKSMLKLSKGFSMQHITNHNINCKLNLLLTVQEVSDVTYLNECCKI